MEKQVKIIVRGGIIQHIESNFDCMIQIIDRDDVDDSTTANKPIYPDLITDVNKFIFEPHIVQGDKVKYLPMLSGYDNKQILTIDRVWFEEQTTLESAFGIYEPKYICSFIEYPNLISTLKDIEKINI